MSFSIHQPGRVPASLFGGLLLCTLASLGCEEPAASGGSDEPPASLPPEQPKGEKAAANTKGAVTTAGSAVDPTHDSTELAAPGPEPSVPGMDDTVDMWSHFAAAAYARDALVGAEDEAYRHAMDTLSRSRPKGLDGLGPYSASIRKAAAEGRDSKARIAQGSAVGRVVTLCGNCHVAAGKGPKVPRAQSPEEGDALKTHMERHRWALERMWEGLLTPDDASWAAGAHALLEWPLERWKFDADPAQTMPLKILASRVHSLGSKALSASKKNPRNEVFGELAATCGDCHRLLGKGGAAGLE